MLPLQKQNSSKSSAGPPRSRVLRWAALSFLSGIAIGLALSGCSLLSPTVRSAESVSKNPAARPAVVYVSDFEMAPDSVQSEDPFAALPLHAYKEESKARSLVATMSNSIVADLGKKGITAERLPANSPIPNEGWLVRGVFQKVDEGDRARRAVIGFGFGQTDLQVAAWVDDLSAKAAALPFYRAQLDATSNKMPGAAITLNPYVAAAKYVIAGHDLDRSAQATAEKIADQVASQMAASLGKVSNDQPIQSNLSFAR
jgi:hypothetical protein